MNNKKKVLRIAVISVLVAVLIFSSLFLYDRSKRFEYAEKNTIAMGTVVSQKIYAEKAGQHISHVREIIDALEKTISWRKAESAVAILNETGTVKSKELADILSVCIKLSEKSDGAFDVTVGGVSSLWNIGEEDERIPSDEEIKEANEQVGYKNIQIDGSEITLLSDCRVDLGAIGKGLACDYVRNYINVCDDIDGAVVSVGGSNFVHGRYNKNESKITFQDIADCLVFVSNCFSTHTCYNKKGDKWRVAVRDPRDENAFLGVISMSEGFVSTSGDYERYFEKDGIRYHHILDGRTGYPASSGLISVTIVCDNGLLSDALSTACFVLGEEKSLELLKEYEASAIFVRDDLTVSVVGEIEFEKM